MMHQQTILCVTPARLARLLFLSSLLATAHGARAQGFKLTDQLTFKAGLTFKETYDDNVYILDTAPYPYLAPPPHSLIATPNKGSMVTTVTPSLNLTYLAGPEFSASLSYVPDMVWYESAPSQNYVAHRAALNFTGNIGEVSCEWLNSAVWIEGSDISLTTMRPGDCRAIGGLPLRDRCDAALYRDSIKVTMPSGNWFFRPVFTSYVHDFQTEQRANLASNKSSYVYDNYIDRWELNGGMDLGYEVMDKTKLFVAYRYGHQGQGTVPIGTRTDEVITSHSQYDSNYQRFLIGLEGTPASWLKLAVITGPETRAWLGDTTVGFDRGETLWYVDAQFTLQPTKEDAIAFKMTRFEQPASTSQSIYQDIKYDLSWRHQCSAKLTVGAGFTAYNGVWQNPVLRDDWIYTPSLMASYAFSPSLTAELSWSHDSAVNRETPVAGTSTQYAENREFERNLYSISLKYTF